MVRNEVDKYMKETNRMNDRPTPETDALFYRHGYPLEIDSSKAMQLCEKLEKERDEARADATALAERLTALELSTTSELARLEQERDEAREKYFVMRDAHNNVAAIAEKYRRERDELRDILRKLLAIIPEPKCHDFGHTKKERHDFLEKCPVVARYDALIAQAKEAVK